MKFGFDASAPVSPAGAVATYGSPAFYQGRPERDDINVLGVLHHEDLGDRVRIDVRYAFTGSVSAAVRAVIDPTKMSWVTQTVLYPGELRSSWEILPDHYPDRLSSAGSHRFTPGGNDGTATLVSVQGELKVHVPLVGRSVERVIVSGLRAYVIEEAAATPAPPPPGG